MWNANQVKIFERALATAEKWEQAIAVLQQLAPHAPQFADRIREIAARAENQRALAQIALTAGRQQ